MRLPSARSLARAGDVLMAISQAAHEGVAALMRRAPAWGLTTVWIGGGDRPHPGAADHVLWLSKGHPADEIAFDENERLLPGRFAQRLILGVGL